MPTFLDAMKLTYGADKISFSQKGQLLEKSQGADAIVVAVGELPYSEGSGNLYDLTLDKDQLDLIREAQATGKPVVVVMIAGRPRIVREVYPATKAFVWAGLPGFEGANAIAGVISGTINPSGKLPFSYPNWPGMYYAYDHKYFDLDIFRNFKDNKTMMAFLGDGMSYTTFEYSNLQISSPSFSSAQTATATVTVKNTGNRAGKESVLWYITDEVATITRPMKQLKHFEKILLNPGESKEVTFEIVPARDLSYPREGKPQLEPGYFGVSVGGKAQRFQLLK